MIRKYVWLVAINSVIAALYLSYLDSSSMYYCGKAESKPSLSLGLSPSWFSGNFQIRRGSKEIISSTDSHKPITDEWVRGAEQFKTITAYQPGNSDDIVIFKALNWDGVEQDFILSERSPSAGNNQVYEVSRKQNISPDAKWVEVSQLSCREGSYRYLTFLFLLVVLITNISVVSKHFRTNKQENHD